MKPIGLYIHIPFCIKKCNYCDFNSFETIELIPAYLLALEKEISKLKGRGFIADTVYIGGGTPTVLNQKQLVSLLECLHENIGIKPQAEFTIEANPGTLNREKLLSLKSLGVNRLSIGLQAYQNRLLKIMGRIHTKEDFDETYETARSVGFDNISADIIFGLPDQEIEDFDKTLKHLAHLSPEHISCYSLSVEEGTEFYLRQQRGNLFLPSEEDERAMYYKAKDFLTGCGFSHYEISNFALTNRESRHNMIYWIYKDYLGLGAGAHSFLNNKRFYNYPLIMDYIKSISEKSNAVAYCESISFEDQQAEFCFLGLRLLKGLSKESFRRQFGMDIKSVYGEAIEKLKKQGLILENSRYIKLTTQGLDFANVVFAEFLP